MKQPDSRSRWVWRLLLFLYVVGCVTFALGGLLLTRLINLFHKQYPS